MSQDRFRLGYVPQLDGLRAIAILGVLAYHARVPFLLGGFVGVEVFFVLSSFLITTLLIQEYDRVGSVNLKHFYMRRVLRLMPALVAMLAVVCAGSLMFQSSEKVSQNCIDAAIALGYMTNWARAFALRPAGILGHTWSLSVEEQFYIVWPILLVLMLRFSRSRQQITLLIGALAALSWMVTIILSVLGANPDRLYNGLDTRASSLMVGALLAMSVTSGMGQSLQRERLRRGLGHASTLSAALILASCMVLRTEWTSLYYGGFLAVDILSSVVILDLVLNRDSVLGTLLANRTLVYIGGLSYGLYLWHYPIYLTMSAAGLRNSHVFILGSVASFLIAAASHQFLEKPVMSLKRYFASSTAASALPTEQPIHNNIAIKLGT